MLLQAQSELHRPIPPRAARGRVPDAHARPPTHIQQRPHMLRHIVRRPQWWVLRCTPCLSSGPSSGCVLQGRRHARTPPPALGRPGVVAAMPPCRCRVCRRLEPSADHQQGLPVPTQHAGQQHRAGGWRHTARRAWRPAGQRPRPLEPGAASCSGPAGLHGCSPARGQQQAPGSLAPSSRASPGLLDLAARSGGRREMPSTASASAYAAQS